MIKRVYIEITNQCNLSCAFCSGNHRPVHFMTPNEFEQILKQVKVYTDYIYLHVQGEPLLHPELHKLLDLCDQYQMQVQLVTNGSLLSRHFDLLEHHSLRKLSISMQSLPYQNTDPDAYMETILSWIKAAADTSVITELRFWRSEELDTPLVHYCMNRLEEVFPIQTTDRRNSLKLADRVFLSYANDFKWPSETFRSNHPSMVTGTCLGARQQLAILSDLTVVPCCLDADGQVPLGNLNENTLTEILDSKHCQSLINQFQSHCIQEPFCQNCTYRHRFD